MQETEVKILEIDRKKIENTLVCLHAEKVFDGEIRTLFFDFEDGRIFKAKNVLRLRKEGNKAELTFKNVHFSQKAKSAEEYSVEVSDLETTRKILENLGLALTESMEKHRVSYMIDHVRFDIDRYFGKYGYIPEFMEIETDKVGLIYKYAELLGFKKQDCLPWSTIDLIRHYTGSENKTANQGNQVS